LRCRALTPHGARLPVLSSTLQTAEPSPHPKPYSNPKTQNPETPTTKKQAIKFLQQAVGLRGYASKDPLTEFKLEGYNLFVDTMARVRRNVIYNVYLFEPQRMAAAPEGGAGGNGAAAAADKQPAAAAAGGGAQKGGKKKVKA